MTTATTTTYTAGNRPAVVTHRVRNLSGSIVEVQGDDEKNFFVDRATKYLQENHFSAASDFADLDRLVFMELLSYRAQRWLGAGKNYYGEFLTPMEATECRRVLKENAPLISAVKNDLGLTKAQRDKEQYESVGKYLTDLKARAREHGVKREDELTKMLCLGKELFAMVGAFDRSDEPERRVLGLESEADIIDWVRSRMKPEFDRIDDYFRKNAQKFWVRTI